MTCTRNLHCKWPLHCTRTFACPQNVCRTLLTTFAISRRQQPIPGLQCATAGVYAGHVGPKQGRGQRACRQRGGTALQRGLLRPHCSLHLQSAWPRPLQHILFLLSHKQALLWPPTDACRGPGWGDRGYFRLEMTSGGNGPCLLYQCDLCCLLFLARGGPGDD